MSSGFEGAMYGRVLKADFELDTLTFEMEAGYAACAGRLVIIPEQTYSQLAEQRDKFLVALKRIANHQGKPETPVANSVKKSAIARAAIANATQQRNATGGEG